ncbi:MAG: shikimate dehydrogenase [Bacteroidaceae bacterium]|nr:shikimate dehydrogenase [Bacteroidaceae bacterium]
MDKYGIIGYPLGHSFSKTYFNDRFASEHIDAEYVNFEIPTIHDFPGVINENPNLRGLNVTIPYKEKVLDYLDELSPNAMAIKAVNVVKVVRRGREVLLVGHNTDVLGFTQSIESVLEPHHKKALVLGTGGASKAVCYGLEQLGIEYQLVSRRETEVAITYEQLTPEIMAEHHIVVNCSPLGMYPHTERCPDIPYDCLTGKHLLYDLVYNPNTTLFMRKGKEHGAQVKNGLEMLLLQAIAAWNIWQED